MILHTDGSFFFFALARPIKDNLSDLLVLLAIAWPFVRCFEPDDSRDHLQRHGVFRSIVHLATSSICFRFQSYFSWSKWRKAKSKVSDYGFSLSGEILNSKSKIKSFQLATVSRSDALVMMITKRIRTYCAALTFRTFHNVSKPSFPCFTLAFILLMKTLQLVRIKNWSVLV